MASVAHQRMTVQEFLQREALTRAKHEYLRGEVYAMAGASPAHNRISSNIHGELIMQLRGKPCHANTSDVMVRAGELLSYPDVSVVCPPVQREPSATEVVLNPKVLVEVLSPSTERYDRNVKLWHYEQLASIEEILLVQQEAALVEHYARGAEGGMLRTAFAGLNNTVLLASINCRLPLAQIYDGVEFPADPFPVPPELLPRVIG
jgi:Uma2 family endonuclease